MHTAIKRSLGAALALSSLALSLQAQSNTIPGTDVSLGILGPMKYWGRSGTFPNGVNGFSMETTSCNLGTVNVPWQAPMASNHPTISFVIVRANAGRLEQISDYSFLKHGFFALSNSQCTPCQNPSGGSFLGVGCSDTYGVNNNGDNYYLAPAEEIDPWLNVWTPQCSHFDKGEPAASPPQDCDGQRSLTSGQASALGPVSHRVRLKDGDINAAGYTFWYQAQYNIRGEPELSRTNNLGSRQVNFAWNGSTWTPTVSGSLLAGSVLQRWTGATVSSSTNGSDDGRLYVAVKVTPAGPDFHYEYAVHNRDNRRGVGALRIPIPAGATVSNFGFRDVDDDAGNQWSLNVTPTEIVVSTPNNPLRWNSIYNVWFDCDVPSGPGTVSLDQFQSGAGAPTVGVVSVVPTNSSCPQASSYCTAKTSSLGCVPSIGSSGVASLSLPGGFQAQVTLVDGQQNGLMFFGTSGQASLPFQGGTLCVNGTLHRLDVINSGGSAGSCSGSFSYSLTDMLFNATGGGLLVVGQVVNAQQWYRDPPGVGLSNGLEFTICP